jgi:hypothetical protein
VSDYFTEGDVTSIKGLPGMWERTGARYRYETDKSHCGICGALGAPWRGWFSGECGHIALLETGECFQKAP